MERTLLIDDTDGVSEGTRVYFALDGDDYEIDLNAGNEAGLRVTLATYIEHARRAAGLPATRRRRTTAPSRQAASQPTVASGVSVISNGNGRPASNGNGERPTYRTADVRDWAKSQRLTVSDRGRIPETIYDAYHAHITGR